MVHNSDSNLIIKDLWLASTWNCSNLVTMLPDFVKHLIMAVIIPSIPRSTDMVIWGTNDTCVYTSKSSFLLLLNKSNTLLVNSIWPRVWKLKAPDKIRMIL